MLRLLRAPESETGMRGVIGGGHAEVSTLEAKLRNCFSMLEESGARSSSGTLPSFRGSFDTTFTHGAFTSRTAWLSSAPMCCRFLCATHASDMPTLAFITSSFLVKR